MLSGFLRVAAASPSLIAGDIVYNTNSILTAISKANSERVKIIVFPELSITGNSIESLFYQDVYLEQSMDALLNIVKISNNFDMVIIVTSIYSFKNKLYNCAFIIKNGTILGIVPKSLVNTENELSQDRVFCDGRFIDEIVEINDYVNAKTYDVPFSTSLLFRSLNDKKISFIVEIGKDSLLQASDTMASTELATIVFNPSSNPEIVDYDNNYFTNIKNKSLLYSLAYVTCGANSGESSSKYTFFSKSAIFELGETINEKESLSSHAIITDIDFDKIYAQKKSNKYLKSLDNDKHVHLIDFEYNTLDYENNNVVINRTINPLPYVNKNNDSSFAYKILNIQAMGLCKRLNVTRSENVVLGLSGGIDSALALIVCLRAFDILKLNKEGIHLYSMPCFGTQKKSMDNAVALASTFGLNLKTINIENTVTSHFSDIDHDANNINSAFENAQARERTQVLFDIANDLNGIVIGTGNLSEAALGFCTYGADHLSSYNVNGSIPKTLIRYMFSSFIKEYEKEENTKSLANILKEFLLVKASPELLPYAQNGPQVTEDIVGPYELNDFFLYYTLKYGFTPYKIYTLAEHCFLHQADGVNYNFTKQQIIATIKSFYKRFVLSAFKRNTAPDSPSIGLPDLSNKNNFYFPSDISIETFLNNIDNL